MPSRKQSNLAPRFLTTAGLAIFFAFAPLSANVRDARAQDDWSVQGDAKRRAEIMRRYKILVEKNPTQGLAFKKLVEYAGGASGLDRLIAEYRGKTEKSPNKVNYWIILGHLLKARAEYEEALLAYDKAIELSPRSSTAYLGRGECRAMLQRNAEASADFEKALSMQKDRAAKQDILRKLADLAFAQRDWEAAQRYYDQLIELDPRNEFLRMEYAQVLVKYKRYDKAIEQYQALIRIAGRDVKAKATSLRDLGDLYEKMGDDEKALETYKKAQSYVKSSNWLYREVEQRIIGVYRRSDRLSEYVDAKVKRWRSPSYDQAMILAALFDELGDEDKAFKYYKLASKKNRRSTDPRVKIIQILQRRGDAKDVVKAYNELIRIAPNQPRYQFDLAKLHFRNGEYDTARKVLDRIRKKFRRDPEAMVSLADLYMRFGMKRDALAIYKQLVKDSPRDETYIISLGEYYHQAGDTEEALETWDKLLKSSLPKAEAHAQLGLILVEHNMIEKGIRHYETAAELDPGNLEIQRGLALAYELGRRWDKAVEAWTRLMNSEVPESLVAESRKRVINIYKRQNRLRTKLREFKVAFEATPPDIEAGFFLAEAYTKLGDTARAERVWRAIVDADGVVDKEDIPALSELEKVYVQRRENDKAIEVLQKLAELRPARARDYYHRIAELSLKTYKEDQAVEYAKLALDKNPDDANGHARLAKVYARMRRIDDAIDSYKQALDLDPRAFRIYFELAQLLLEKGDVAEASRLYRYVATRAVDEVMILDAARRAVALAETDEQLALLESELAPMVFKTPVQPVYRKIMLEIYGRMVAPLVARRNFGAAMTSAESARLEAISNRAFPVLMDAVQSEDIGQRQLAVRMLGELRLGTAAFALARMVADEAEPLRLQAAVAVAQIGDDRAEPMMLSAISDPRPGVRETATWALGAVGGRDSTRALIELLEKGQSSKQQQLAAVSLGRIGDKRAERALLKVVSEGAVRRYSDELTFAAVFGLGLIGQSGSAAALQDVLVTSRSSSGDAAAWALGQIRTEESLKILLGAYWGEDERVRERARRGLVWFAADRDSARDHYRDFLAESQFVIPREVLFHLDSLAIKLEGDVLFMPMVSLDVLFVDHADVIASNVMTRLELGPPGVQTQVLDDLSDANALLGLARSAPTGEVTARRRELLASARPLLLKLLEGDEGAAVNASAGAFVGWVQARSRLGAGWLRRVGLVEAKRSLRVLETDDSIARERFLQSFGPASRSALVERERPAMRLLGQLGDPRDLEIILRRVTSPSAQTRRHALAALGEGYITSPRCVEALRAALSDEHYSVRAQAASSLARVDAASRDAIVEALAGLLDDEFSSVQIASAEALGVLQDDRAVPALIGALESDVVDVQRAALAALVEIGGPASSAALEPWRDHPDPRLRRAANP